MVIFPQSKINLGLNIISRRPDGYHDLQTVMVPIGWSDILEIVPARGNSTTLTVSGNPIDCPTEKNLVMKAYRAVKKIVPELPPVDIYIRKIVPDGAGLGGGSADATATVSGLDRLFALSLGSETLSDLCSTIGADCPFFLHTSPMLATGTGTQLREVDVAALRHLHITVAKPPFGISTSEAYRNVTPSHHELDLPALLNAPVESWRDTIFNSFEDSVFPSHPRLAAIKEHFYRMGALYAAMSGSGSAVFGLSRGDILADTSAQPLKGCAIWSGPVV